MTAELKVGVIGCGGHAQSHFAMIKAEPRMKLVAIAELNETRRAEAQAKHQPAAAFGDYRDMLDKAQLDVVYVVTLAGHLLPIVRECLGRNLHTSIEKSPGYTTAETRQMVEAAHQKAQFVVARLGKAAGEVAFGYLPRCRGKSAACGRVYGIAHICSTHRSILHNRSTRWGHGAPLV